MQETRKHILEILHQKKQATVDEIVACLGERRGAITPVTVRHHLNHLQREGLITEPELRHREGPGRPQHVYGLTDKALEQFPGNYRTLAEALILQIERNLPDERVNVIIEGVAGTMAQQANISDRPLAERIKQAVVYLNEHGYSATYEPCAEGFILRTHNCPYHHIAQKTERLCSMDLQLISSLIGVVPRLLSRISDGDASCAYLIPDASRD
ncbi:MAG: hypothetical protein EA396_11315 [Anaerolineaceae bacterium]|nr:MAG: hypothetical protein EA396_11315 [Anaerolineaceae bacterium]